MPNSNIITSVYLPNHNSYKPTTDSMIVLPREKNEDTALIANIVAKKEDILNFVKKSVEENKEEEQGSTLTFGSLDDKGNLKFAKLGDSPVYLVVKDKNNNDIVIQISSDMDHNSDRYTKLCIAIEPTNNKYLNKDSDEYKTHDKIEHHRKFLDKIKGQLETFGAIGDSEIKGIIRKPEFYDFSEGTIFYKELNAFLTEKIGTETTITELLKTGDANVVMASDGLNEGKIDGKSVCDYKMRLTGNISKAEYDSAKNCLPAPTGIEFTTIEKDKVLNPKENPIVLIANNKITEATKKTDTLGSNDDVTILPLKIGTTGLVLDGHGGRDVSYNITNAAKDFINDINNRQSRLNILEEEMKVYPNNRALKDAVEFYQNKQLKQNSTIINVILGCNNGQQIIECERKYALHDVKNIKKYLSHIMYGTTIEQNHETAKYQDIIRRNSISDNQGLPIIL